ncbi:EF-hand domain-containing protein [Psychromonas ossibalaenae]|uniref:EF-hand domain-containing protein n=1 Tax=Psychromonas ossibalaenae TaxID=444922 RepID=UPI00146B083D|nr:EF-hand domain-containing protein [Psychromonas ossibalaenae]
MKKYTLITAAILMGTATYTFANLVNENVVFSQENNSSFQSDKQHKGPTFAQLDKDGDGEISKSEARGRLLVHFDDADTSGSGTLSAAEFDAFKMNYTGKSSKQHKQRPTFAQLDSNDDGQLSRDDLQGRLLADFDKIDTDGSGMISQAEFEAFKSERKGKSGKHHKRQTFAQLDSNNDGQLSRDDVQGRLLANFDQIDTDGSGMISQAEFETFKSERKGKGGKHHKRQTFAQLDSNNDGQLSKDDLQGRLLANFDQIDTDGSGMISQAEFEAFKSECKGKGGKHHKRQTFAQLDSNSDGQLSKDDLQGRLLADFDNIDTDGSGMISQAEFEAFKSERKGKGGKHHKGGNFTLQDSNNEGQLSRDEGSVSNWQLSREGTFISRA